MEPLGEDVSVLDHGAAVVAASTLRRMLADLKPAQAEAIRLVKLEGYSVEEAARALGQSTSLVKVNVHRGLKRLAVMARAETYAD